MTKLEEKAPRLIIQGPFWINKLSFRNKFEASLCHSLNRTKISTTFKFVKFFGWIFCFLWSLLHYIFRPFNSVCFSACDCLSNKLVLICQIHVSISFINEFVLYPFINIFFIFFVFSRATEWEYSSFIQNLFFVWRVWSKWEIKWDDFLWVKWTWQFVYCCGSFDDTFQKK